MDKDYQAILEKLETSIKEIEDQGISTKTIISSIGELKKYTEKTSIKPALQSHLTTVNVLKKLLGFQQQYGCN
jgi:hypothetical protein